MDKVWLWNGQGLVFVNALLTYWLHLLTLNNTLLYLVYWSSAQWSLCILVHWSNGTLSLSILVHWSNGLQMRLTRQQYLWSVQEELASAEDEGGVWTCLLVGRERWQENGEHQLHCLHVCVCVCVCLCVCVYGHNLITQSHAHTYWENQNDIDTATNYHNNNM